MSIIDVNYLDKYRPFFIPPNSNSRRIPNFTDPEQQAATYPKLINSISLNELYNELLTVDSEHFALPDSTDSTDSLGSLGSLDHAAYQIIFKIPKNNVTSYITIAIQQDYILDTKLRQKHRILSSFKEAWNANQRLRIFILSAENTYEAMWQGQLIYQYKIATTFMPLYAKSIYNYFLGDTADKIVVDPCAGWGDRLIGAMASGVGKYIGFDTNSNLFNGYQTLLELGSVTCSISDNMLTGSNDYHLINGPFETYASMLNDNLADLVFTSPPFFDYEIYTDINPTYHNWINEFYVPLVQNSSRILKVGSYMALHIDDTSAGQIMSFLDRISEFTDLEFKFKIGLYGTHSSQIRNVWCYQKMK